MIVLVEFRSMRRNLAPETTIFFFGVGSQGGTTGTPMVPHRGGKCNMELR